MKYFIKLPQIFIGKTSSEAENHNAGLNKHHNTTLETLNDPSGIIPKVNWSRFSTVNRSTD